MSKTLMEMAAEIVQGQVSRNPMSSEEIVSSLRIVFNALGTMKKAEAGDTNLDAIGAEEQASDGETAPARTDPKDSIREESVVCLECGSELRQLTAKHLESHGLSARQYKKKWGFPLRQPLAAKSLSKSRSKAAKKRGLPANLREFLDARQQMKIEVSAAESPATPIEPEITARKKTVIRRRKKAEV